MDEATAWELLLQLAAGRRTGQRPMEAEVRGFGLRLLPDGGWEVGGKLDPRAEELLELFLPLVGPERVVIGQMGQSLDGQIATESGHSHYVTGREDIRRLHRLRALVDAVVVGVGTVLADDPRLTVREVPGRHPVRVVLDPRGRTPAAARLVSDGAAPTLLIERDRDGGLSGGQGSWAEVESVSSGWRRVTLPARDGGHFAPKDVLRLLGEMALHRVLVEGGGVTVSRFLRAGVLDRLHVTVAPLLIGGGRPGLTVNPARTLSGALRPSSRTFRLGRDVLFDLDLRTP